MPSHAQHVQVDRLAWTRRQPASVSFSLGRGERLYVCGTDAGTLLLAIGGFVEAASGKIVCEGRDLTGVAPPTRHVAYIPPGDSLIDRRSLRANVALPGADAARSMAALDRVGLGAVAGREARSLLPAQRRLGALARALATDPALLLIEEAADDPPAIPDLLAALDRPCAIIAAALPGVALARADRILLLRDSGAVQLSTPRDLYERPADAFAALWSGACNLIPATLDGAGAASGSVAARIGDHLAPARFRDAISGRVALAVRPHRLRIDPAGLRATVASVDYQGAATSLHLRTEAGIALRLDAAEPPSVTPGEAVRVAWDWSDAWPVPALPP